MMKIATILPTLKQFLQDESGVASIEAAISYPAGFLIFLGMIDIGLLVYGNAALNVAAKDIAYEGAVECQVDERDGSGNCVSGTERVDQAFINDALQGYAFNLIQPENLCIRTCTVQSRAGATTCNSQANSSGIDLGGTEDVVRYEFTYQWSPFFPLMEQFLGEIFNFQAVYVVRNGYIPNGTANRMLVWSCPS